MWCAIVVQIYCSLTVNVWVGYQECGVAGVVSGNYAAPPSNGTDRHTDTKLDFRENEAAIDYSASFMCALSAYADMPAGAQTHSL